MLAAASALLAGVGFVFASAHPDSLEALARIAGIADRATALLPTPLADYQLSALPPGFLAKATAGLIGLMLVYAICTWSGRWF